MVNFYLKDKNKPKTSVVAQVYINGTRLRIATGISVLSAFWLPGKQRLKVKGNYFEAEEINIKLNQIEETIKTNAVRYKLSQTIPQSEDLLKVRKDTKSLVEYGRSFIQNSTLSNETIKKYVTALGKMEEYQKHTGKTILFSDIDIAFFKQYRKWFYEQVNPLTSLPYSRNYFGSIIKIIKVLVNRAKEEGLTDGSGIHHSQFTTDSENTTSVYLTSDELMKIHRMAFDRHTIEKLYPAIREQDLKAKIKSLEIVRARFILGAYTGLRVSDYLKLPPDYIEDKISLRTKKTGQDIVIPVHPVLREIRASGWLSKTISQQKINVQIKEICRLAGIVEPVTIYREHGTKTVSRTEPKCELVTTHTARRSFATNAYLAGVPAISIMKITGHLTESAFLKYIRISQQENADVLSSHPFFNNKVVTEVGAV